MIAGIELGGTKTVVAIGSVDGRVIEEFRFPTTLPQETLDVAIEWLRARGQPTSIGIAAFGPIGIVPNRDNYGKVLETPKAGWAGFSLVGCLASAFPTAGIILDTDVNAAALAEARIGAGIGLDAVAYITVGTGIGGGILSGGHLIHGALHPEFGHLKVPRMAGDDFPGTCSFHGDCLEGLASGPAIARRRRAKDSLCAPRCASVNTALGRMASLRITKRIKRESRPPLSNTVGRCEPSALRTASVTSSSICAAFATRVAAKPRTSTSLQLTPARTVRPATA